MKGARTAASVEMPPSVFLRWRPTLEKPALKGGGAGRFSASLNRLRGHSPRKRPTNRRAVRGAPLLPVFRAGSGGPAAIFPEVQSDLRTFGSGPISKLGKEAISMRTGRDLIKEIRAKVKE